MALFLKTCILKSLRFQAPKTLLSCKWMVKMHKKFWVENWRVSTHSAVSRYWFYFNIYCNLKVHTVIFYSRWQEDLIKVVLFHTERLHHREEILILHYYSPTPVWTDFIQPLKNTSWLKVTAIKSTLRKPHIFADSIFSDISSVT